MTPGTPLVQNIDARVWDALGIPNRGANYRGHLSPWVQMVVQLPLEAQAVQQSLGFNDAETTNQNAWGGFGAQTAGAAQISVVQLLNPSGSGRIVFVDRITLWVSAADSLRIASHDTALTTLIGAPGTPRWKYFGTGAPSCVIRTQLLGAAPSTYQIQQLRIASVNAEVGHDFNPPIRLDEGKGMVVHDDTNNITLSCNFMGREYLA